MAARANNGSKARPPGSEGLGTGADRGLLRFQGRCFVDQVFDAMAQNWVWTMIGSIAIVSIVFGAVKTMVTTTARERTRREIAAYIAEGTMTPEQGERIMSAKAKDSGSCCG